MTVERFRSPGDDSKLESLRAELAQRKLRTQETFGGISGFKQIQGEILSRGGGGGTRYIKKEGMLVENFEIDP